MTSRKEKRGYILFQGGSLGSNETHMGNIDDQEYNNIWSRIADAIINAITGDIIEIEDPFLNVDVCFDIIKNLLEILSDCLRKVPSHKTRLGLHWWHLAGLRIPLVRSLFAWSCREGSKTYLKINSAKWSHGKVILDKFVHRHRNFYL